MRKIIILAAALVVCHAAASYAGENVVSVSGDEVVGFNETKENAVVIFGNLSVSGTVEEDTVVIFGNLDITGTGRLLGDTVVIFGNINRAPGAEVANKVVSISPCKTASLGACVLPILGICALSAFGLAIFFSFIALALLVAVLFTERVGRASFYIQGHPWKALYYGGVASLLVAPITLLLIVSILGIPLVPLFIILVSAAMLFGYVVVCQWLGVKFFKALKKTGQPMLLEVIIGFAILWAISIIPILGWLVKLTIWSMGLGAVVATKFGNK